MNSTFLGRWAVATVALIFLEGCAHQEPRQEARPTAVVPFPPAATVPTPVRLSPPPPAVVPIPMATSPVVAAPEPVPTKLTSAVVEVMKLHTKHVSDEVVLSYIQAATTPFALGANEIVYLTDIGLPPALITAMVKRDTQLGGVVSANSFAALTNEAGMEQTTPEPIPSQEIGHIPTEPAPEALEAPEAVPPIPADETTVYYYYDTLSPYGTWTYVEGYGWCWQPSAATTISGWRPYVDNGCWLWCDDGWYWHSYYTWGWAPFHYGRWFRHPHRGWIWYPDRQWGPAWVVWRQAGDYCGWAPLPPSARWHHGLGLTYWDRNFDPAFGWNLPGDTYHYIPTMHFCASDLTRHGVSAGLAQEIHTHAAIINVAANTRMAVVNRGPGRETVGALSQNRVRAIAVRETPANLGRSYKPERLATEGNSLVLYRPQLPNTAPARPSALPNRPTGPVPARPANTPARIPVPPRDPQGIVVRPPTDSGAGSAKPSNLPPIPRTEFVSPTSQPITTRAPVRPSVPLQAPVTREEIAHTPHPRPATERPAAMQPAAAGAPLLPARPPRASGTPEGAAPGSSTLTPSAAAPPTTPPARSAPLLRGSTPPPTATSPVTPTTPNPVPVRPTPPPPSTARPATVPPTTASAVAPTPTAPVPFRPSPPSTPASEAPAARIMPAVPARPQLVPAPQPIIRPPTPSPGSAPAPATPRVEPTAPVYRPAPVQSVPIYSPPSPPRPTYIAPPTPSYTPPPAVHSLPPATPAPSFSKPPASHPPAPAPPTAAPHNSSDNNKNKPGK